MKFTSGFSLLEVLTAIAIMALGLLAIFAVLTFGVKANRHGEMLGQAANLNREIISLIKGRGWAFDPNYAPDLNDAPLRRRRLDEAPFQDDLAKYHDSPFRSNVLVTRLSSVPGNFENKIARIRVTLYWQEGTRQEELPLEAYARL